ncbi:MAG: DUF883 family protein [Methylotenera sp.]|jgi:ElaB/YqjD/DUF883 family membrane-anchored ribosome-binding protein|uniref:DUF883 family protein n=1 Tax=Methylotenera sp. TaxID=2051956 RepID=UPI002719CEAC|nr:DUF883 family protein [Methylotenera sp.]MDO9149787.1 DUF883 family protein [Methylotenera sp.]
MDNFSSQLHTNQLVGDIKEVMLDAEALLAATVDTGDKKIAEIRAKSEQSLSRVRAKLDDLQTDALLSVKAATKATDVYVHEKPWRAIGFAASLGVVIGLLIGRRH